ncbi:MAG: hypothetical protein ACE37F_32050 [Nannocystaceae bacterium]|nr:hypothetical protein [bacterium]
MSDVQAAPPDAGGHLGSLTRPEEVLMRPSELQRHEASPPLHRMHAPRSGRRGTLAQGLVVGAIAFGLLGAFVFGIWPAV